MKDQQIVHAEMKRREEASADKVCACECVDNQQNTKMQNGLILTGPYSAPPGETPLGIQEMPTLEYNHTLTATANNAYLIICGNLPLTIQTFQKIKAGDATAVIYSLEDSNRLNGDMSALISAIASCRRINKDWTKVNVETDKAAFGNKQFTTYRFQGTNLIPEPFYLRNKLPDKQNPKISEFSLPAHLDLDVAFVVRADGGVTGETLNISISLGSPENLYPEQYKKDCRG